MSILVTGATGTVGKEIVNQLVEREIKVSALSRKEISNNFVEGVQFVVGDLDDPKTIKPHLENINGLLLITQSSNSEEKFLSNQKIIQLAKEANVKKIVAIMDYAGNPIEEIIKNSGMEWTILRPVEFMKNVYFDWAETIQNEGVVRTAFPDTLGARIHELDIASVAVRALTEKGHSEQIYDLTGPEALSIRDMVNQISAITGKPVTAKLK